MKINFLYHTPQSIYSGYMGSSGLKRAFERTGLLNYAYDQMGDKILDVQELRSAPIFSIKGFLNGRMPITRKCQDQFHATWQAESWYTRRGDMDESTKHWLKNKDYFHMIFTSADTDLEMYDIPTYHLPSWADCSIMDECGAPEWDELGFIGGSKGREDFLGQDKTGIIRQEKTKLYRDPELMTRKYAELISKFKILVSPPGRCFTGMCGRAWEIMACRRLALVYYNLDTMPITSRRFADGIHLAYWQTFDELVDKYRYYLKNDAMREKIATAGYEKVRLFGNQNVRARYIVSCMETEYHKWLQSREAVPEDVDNLCREIEGGVYSYPELAPGCP